jgi:hypothetical protein
MHEGDEGFGKLLSVLALFVARFENTCAASFARTGEKFSSYGESRVSIPSSPGCRPAPHDDRMENHVEVAILFIIAKARAMNILLVKQITQ